MKALVLVIDSFGIGEAPDAGAYGDQGSHTALHIGQALGAVQWPALQRLGLGNAAILTGPPIPGCEPIEAPEGSFGVLSPLSPGKDTTTGHWEMAGIILDQPFHIFPPTYPSFPPEITDELTRRSGLSFLGNRAASGTQIIEDLGEEHLKTRKPILYTSGDSVIQIAAHEDILPLANLYALCEIAREIGNAYRIGRVIARPFRGTSGAFERTTGRHDYSFALPCPSVLDHLRTCGIQTIGVGKIGDIFNHQGLDQSFPDKGNPDCLKRTMSLVEAKGNGNQLIFVNLVDTDMNFGHRRDPQGYHDSVKATDDFLADLMGVLGPEDHLLITADHGCDPTFRGTDHTRERVPLLYWNKKSPGLNLGSLNGLSQISKVLCRIFAVPDFNPS